MADKDNWQKKIGTLDELSDVLVGMYPDGKVHLSHDLCKRIMEEYEAHKEGKLRNYADVDTFLLALGEIFITAIADNTEDIHTPSTR